MNDWDRADFSFFIGTLLGITIGCFGMIIALSVAGVIG